MQIAWFGGINNNLPAWDRFGPKSPSLVERLLGYDEFICTQWRCSASFFNISIGKLPGNSLMCRVCPRSEGRTLPASASRRFYLPWSSIIFSVWSTPAIANIADTVPCDRKFTVFFGGIIPNLRVEYRKITNYGHWLFQYKSQVVPMGGRYSKKLTLRLVWAEKTEWFFEPTNCLNLVFLYTVTGVGNRSEDTFN